MIKKLEPKFVKAAQIIKDAAENGRLIILRHHADCDGYAAALCLEEVLLPIVSKRTERIWKYYKRLPMKTPFYDYPDALRDLGFFKEALKFGKKPLLLMLDNGCGQEDLLPLSRVKEYDVEIVIVDHHVYSKEVDKLVDLHINPRLVGGDGSITTGMLSFEISSKLGDAKPIYPAVSAVSDKSSDELIEKYSKLAGKEVSYLTDLAVCVDFEAYTLRFSDSDLIYDVFRKPKTIELLLPEIKNKIDSFEPAIKKFFKQDGRIGILDLDKVAMFGEYPTAGKLVGIAHRMGFGPRITLGIAKDFITFRVDKVNFSISNVLSTLKQRVPHGNINGGGHDYAGTIKFVPGAKEEVLAEMKKLITR